MVNVPKGCIVCNNTVKIAGQKNKEFEVPVIKDIIIKSETRV